jgi:signal transduction histidine kinase
MRTDTGFSDYLTWFHKSLDPQRGLMAHFLRQGLGSSNKAVYLRDAHSNEAEPLRLLSNKSGKHYCPIRPRLYDIVDLIQYARNKIDHKILGGIKNKSRPKTYRTKKMVALETLAGGIAHNFNNLFMGIQGNVSLMLLDLASDHPNCEKLKRIEKLIQSESMLTNDLLGHLVRISEYIRIGERNDNCKVINLRRRALPPDNLRNLTGGIAWILKELLLEIQEMIAVMQTRPDYQYINFEKLKRMENLVQRGFSLVSNLMDYAGNWPGNSDGINLNRLVETALDTYFKTERRIKFDLSVDGNLLGIKAHLKQIEKILFHLFKNAADAMPSGGKLFLGARNASHKEIIAKPGEIKLGRYVLLTIQDTGRGIDEKALTRIFDPFFTSKEPDQGAGLGLACVDGILNTLGGHIRVYSKPGSGTTFKIYLPGYDLEPITTKRKDLTAQMHTAKDIVHPGNNTPRSVLYL